MLPLMNTSRYSSYSFSNEAVPAFQWCLLLWLNARFWRQSLLLGWGITGHALVSAFIRCLQLRWLDNLV